MAAAKKNVDSSLPFQYSAGIRRRFCRTIRSTCSEFKIRRSRSSQGYSTIADQIHAGLHMR